MISPDFFINSLSQRGIDFFAGVPDSLLKNICAYIADHKDGHHNIIAANEGAAVGLAAGHYLATGHIPVVYMQNSGEGNIINHWRRLRIKMFIAFHSCCLSDGEECQVCMMSHSMSNRGK